MEFYSVDTEHCSEILLWFMCTLSDFQCSCLCTIKQVSYRFHQKHQVEHMVSSMWWDLSFCLWVLCLWVMTMNFPGMAGQAGGAGSKQSSNYTAGPGGRKPDLQGIRGVEIHWSGWPALVEVTEWWERAAVAWRSRWGQDIALVVRLVTNAWSVETCR